MENKAFTEGVRPGGVTTSHEIIILICYIMDSVDKPVTFNQLNEAMQEQHLINYFEFANAMEHLQRAGHILPYDNESKQYVLSPLGKSTAKTFEATLPAAVKERGVIALNSILKQIRRQKENRVTIEKKEDGFVVTLTIPDIGSDLLSVSIFMPTRKECEAIQNRFLNDPMLVYKGVFALLTGDLNTVGDLVTEDN